MRGVSGSAAGPELGLWSATALVVGHTIGVGIFLTPTELIGALGSPALTFGLWLSCGALVLAGAFTVGELASRFPQALAGFALMLLGLPAYHVLLARGSIGARR